MGAGVPDKPGISESMSWGFIASIVAMAFIMLILVAVSYAGSNSTNCEAVAVASTSTAGARKIAVPENDDQIIHDKYREHVGKRFKVKSVKAFHLGWWLIDPEATGTSTHESDDQLSASQLSREHSTLENGVNFKIIDCGKKRFSTNGAEASDWFYEISLRGTNFEKDLERRGRSLTRESTWYKAAHIRKSIETPIILLEEVDFTSGGRKL